MWFGEEVSGDDRNMSDCESGDRSSGNVGSWNGWRKPGNFKNRKVDRSSIKFSDFSNPWNFYIVFLNEEEVGHQWCRDNGLLALSLPCNTDSCDGQAVLRRRKGYVANESFRCNKNVSHERQTREYSLSEAAKIPTNNVMLVIKSYLEGNTLRQCATFAGISYGSSAVEWGGECSRAFQGSF